MTFAPTMYATVDTLVIILVKNKPDLIGEIGVIEITPSFLEQEIYNFRKSNRKYHFPSILVGFEKKTNEGKQVHCIHT